MFRRTTFFAFAASLCFVTICSADWPRFRGPNGSGISGDSTETPVKWGPEDVSWKVDLPGTGVSSPIIVGDNVFVTCYSGYGTSREDLDDINELKRHLVCVDRKSGKIRWTKTVDAVQPEDPYSGMGIPAHGYASHTPTSDGENVYVFFGKSGVLAYDFDGNELWKSSVGTGSDPKRWGSSSSPILYGDLVIVTASAESSALVGLNKKTGDEVWRQEAEGLTDIWGTPLLAKVDGRTDLVIGVPYEFWGLNPETGKLRWYSEAMDTDSYNSSVVESEGVIYGIEGRGGGSAAVKVGGKGDVTDANTVWTGNDSARFGTPLVYDGRIYYFSNGVANCIDAEDGTSIFKGRLPSSTSNSSRERGPSDGPRREGERFAGGPGGGPDGPPSGRGARGGPGGGRGGFGGRGGGRGGFGAMDYSSPVAADGKVYYVKSDGTTYVINASDEFELLSTNKITEEPETFSGTPAISDGQIIVRSNKRLYSLGAK